LTVRTDVQGGVDSTRVTNNGTGVVTINGTLTQINTTFAAANGIRYRGNLNFNGTDTVVILANDNGNIGVGGPLTHSAPIPLTIEAVNDYPVLDTLPGTRVFDEESPNAYIQLSVADVDAMETTNGFVTVTLSVTQGTLVVRPTVSGGVGSSGDRLQQRQPHGHLDRHAQRDQHDAAELHGLAVRAGGELERARSIGRAGRGPRVHRQAASGRHRGQSDRDADHSDQHHADQRSGLLQQRAGAQR
jgi:hypothetical protein